MNNLFASQPVCSTVPSSPSRSEGAMRGVLGRSAIASLIACSLMIGCDYLPEAISGRPDPNAPTITAVGPTETTGSTDMVTQQGQRPLGETEVLTSSVPNQTGNELLSSGVTPAGAQESANEGLTRVINSGGASPASGSATFLPNSQPAANGTNLPGPGTESGIAVPPASTIAPSADGRILIPSAYLRFVNDIPVAAPADGLITQLKADEGDQITAGDLVVQLDDRLALSELDVTTKEYEAAVEKAKDESEIKYSEAAFSVAKAEYKINQELEKKGASTYAETQKKWLEAVRAELAITVAQLKHNQDIAGEGVSRAKQGAAKVQIALRQVTAPFDGIVAKKIKEQHDWVRAGDVILRLVSMEQLRAVGQVRVDQLSAAPHELVNAPAVVEIRLYPGRTERIETKVGFVSPVMESTGGYEIWLQFNNLKANDQWIFREGMPARIEISTR